MTLYKDDQMKQIIILTGTSATSRAFQLDETVPVVTSVQLSTPLMLSTPLTLPTSIPVTATQTTALASPPLLTPSLTLVDEAETGANKF